MKWFVTRCGFTLIIWEKIFYLGKYFKNFSVGNFIRKRILLFPKKEKKILLRLFTLQTFPYIVIGNAVTCKSFLNFFPFHANNVCGFYKQSLLCWILFKVNGFVVNFWQKKHSSRHSSNQERLSDEISIQ